MIIACEKCGSKFKLDESLLTDEGSKVRCSLCKHVFTAYPTGAWPIEETGTYEDVDETLQETVALDSPPALQGSEATSKGSDEGTDFDAAFERAIEKESISESYGEELPDENDLAFRDEAEGRDGAGKLGSGNFEGDQVTAGPAEAEDGEKGIEPSSEKEKPRRFGLLLKILLILFVLVAACVAIFFFKPEMIPDAFHFLKPVTKQEVMDLGVSRLNFKAVSGSFVESKEAGQLFIIKGMISNDYPRTRSHIFIQGSLLDDQGTVVKRKTSYAGNALTEKELQEMPMTKIDEALENKSGKGNMNVDIQPGKAIPIMIVFDDLPDNLSEFTVEAVSSSAGQ